MSKLDKLVSWRIDNKTPVMTKQFTFESYEETRAFVNDLSDYSEKIGYYPNLTFSQTQATVTVFTDQKTLGDDEYDFAHQTDQIAELCVQQVRLSND